MGRQLAAAGVVVVSGLAHGIDMAAHAGAVEVALAPPVAVLGTAHDGRATPEQVRLRTAVSDTGAVMSELPPGDRAARWRFAVRNRVLAASADLVVVVECHVEGGALHTARAARRRRLPLAAVPGPVGSPASAGTNALLVAGANCVRDAGDVLSLLAQAPTGSPASRPAGPEDPPPRPATSRGAALGSTEAAVLQAVEDVPSSLEQVVVRANLKVGTVALALEHLVDAGLVESAQGWWQRRRYS